MSEDDVANPVFVDPTGRRRRIVRRITAALITLGGAYAVLLIVLAVAGVQVDAPGLPLIEKIPHVFDANPKVPQAPTGRNNGSQVPGLPPSVLPTASGTPTTSSGVPSSHPTGSPTAQPPGSPSAHPTSSPTVRPSGSHSPTSTVGKIKSSTAPGATHRPVH